MARIPGPLFHLGACYITCGNDSDAFGIFGRPFRPTRFLKPRRSMTTMGESTQMTPNACALNKAILLAQEDPIMAKQHSHKSKRVSNKFRFGRLIIIGVVMLLASLPTKIVQAAWWSIASDIMCSGSTTVQGASFLFWGGYAFWDRGTSTGYLWRWIGTTWYLHSSDTVTNQGSGGGATAGPSAYSGSTNTWTETGGHTATFFSGQQNSYSAMITCP